MVDFTVTLVNTAESGLSADELDLLERSMLAAGELWARYIDAPGVTLEIEFNVGWIAEGRLAGAASTQLMYLRTTDDGVALFEQNTIQELRGGEDYNGSDGYDIKVRFNPTTLESIYALDLNPEQRSAPVAEGKSDIVGVLLHEIGHGLGFGGYYSGRPPSELFSESRKASFGALLEERETGIYFVGENAKRLAGRDIELEIRGDGLLLYHLGNLPARFGSKSGAPGFGADLGAVVMRGLYTIDEVRYNITALDIAVLKDLGIPIKEATSGDDHLYGFYKPDPGIEAYFKVPNPEFLMGNDEISGGEGDDTLDGVSGLDTLKGDAGADVLLGREDDDLLIGGSGSDVSLGGEGNDALWAGGTDDSADTLIGGAGNDILGGGPGNDFLVGGGGDEGTILHLSDQSEDSKLDGRDTLYGAGGNDTVLGGGWDDGLVNDNGKFDVGEQITSGTDDNVIWSGDGDDLVYGAAGHDVIGAKDGSDTVYGGAGNDTVYGGASVHADLIFGEAGNDILYAGAGDDTIDGGAGNDRIVDGLGDDVYSGGSGADTFVFTDDEGSDRISDFSLTSDILDISATATDFSSIEDVKAAATAMNGGISIDLGGGHLLLLDGLTVDDIGSVNFFFFS